MRNRGAVVLYLVAALWIGLAWIGESRGQTRIPRVGIVTLGQGLTGEQDKKWWEPFRRTLADQGWVEGKTALFEYSGTADELARLKVDAILAVSAPSTRAAYAATRTIPIVALDFTNDPVAAGYAESYGHPGRNLTGVFLDAPEFSGKWLQLMKVIVPGLSHVVVLWDPAPGAAHLQALKTAGRSLLVKLQVLQVRKPDDIDRAFSALRGTPQALIILPSPMIYQQSERLAKLALQHRLPGTSYSPSFAEAGGLLSYGPDAPSSYERCAVLLAKILAGARPGDLPVERPTKYQLIVNLKTAKTLGLTVPDSVLVRADEVIQ